MQEQGSEEYRAKNPPRLERFSVTRSQVWALLSLHMRAATATWVLTSSSLPPDPPRQLAYGQDGQLKGFAVLEYETAEMAEEAQQRADGLALGGSHLRVSFCAPGPPGRSMLAALIAAQATVSACLGGVPPGWGWGTQGPDPPLLKSQGVSWTRDERDG